MPQITDYQHISLVGIKGVGMTALAQCLLDMGKTVTGYDVDQSFVTEEILIKRKLRTLGLESELDANCQCVVYSAAYDPTHQSLLVQATKRQLPILTLAEAVAQLFNQKTGIAVCGVGGKSSVSAWITWMLDQLNRDVSAVVGVGQIHGLSYTGQWNSRGQYFVAEADEYAQNPMGVKRGETLIPRFMSLQPQIIVCTNLKYDHPDVYQDFSHTKAVFAQFFHQLKPNGTMIYNGDDGELVEIAQTLSKSRPDIHLLSFGTSSANSVQLINREVIKGQSEITTQLNVPPLNTQLQFEVSCPGQFFAINSLAVLTVGLALQLSLTEIRPTLSSFNSVSRRFEKHGQWQGVQLVDDYAHTPHELATIIGALREVTKHDVIVCFQPHTFSRTKTYLTEFVTSLALADKVILLPIFPSAREAADPQTSSEQILDLLKSQSRPAWLCQNFQAVAQLLPQICQVDDTFATLGAGDVYQILDILTGKNHDTD